MPRSAKPKPELLIDEKRQRYVVRTSLAKTCQIINWPAPRSPLHLQHMAAMMRQRGYLVHSLTEWQTTRQSLKVGEAALVLGIKINTAHWRIGRGQLATIPGSGDGKGNLYLIPISAVSLEQVKS